MTQRITELEGQLVAQSAVAQQAQQQTGQPTFTAKTVKLDLPAKFDGRPAALTSWLFDIEQYCVLVGIVSPTEMVKLAVSRLEKDAHTWWRQLNNRGVDYSLGHLGWQDFKSELADAFNDVDRKLKLRRKLQ